MTQVVRALTHIDHYARFLLERGVETLLATGKRLRVDLGKALRKAEATGAGATLDEGEYGEIAHRDDPDDRRHIPFMLGWTVALLLAAVDWVPANLSAQVFGQDEFVTAAITLVFVIALAAAMVIAPEAEGFGRDVTIAAIFIGLAFTGFLRGWFILVVANNADLVAAILQAAALVAFSGMVLIIGVATLLRTRSWAMERAHAKASASRAEADWWARKVMELKARLEILEANYTTRAQAYAGKARMDDETRRAFMQRVYEDLADPVPPDDATRPATTAAPSTPTAPAPSGTMPAEPVPTAEPA